NREKKRRGSNIHESCVRSSPGVFTAENASSEHNSRLDRGRNKCREEPSQRISYRNRTMPNPAGETRHYTMNTREESIDTIVDTSTTERLKG
ncbi:hypothetical protein J6590_104446, partial [Homalodisca vitripennis]